MDPASSRLLSSGEACCNGPTLWTANRRSHCAWVVRGPLAVRGLMGPRLEMANGSLGIEIAAGCWREGRVMRHPIAWHVCPGSVGSDGLLAGVVNGPEEQKGVSNARLGSRLQRQDKPCVRK